jgi:uncharacterized membrane protein
LGLLPFFKKKPLLSAEQNERIVEAIRNAEKCTSGEVRVYVESHCRYVDPLDRAIEIFAHLKMQETQDRNAVLVYVAIKDRQLAIFADQGIHEKTGPTYWQVEVERMIREFNKENYADGIAASVASIGKALETYFPYNSDTDKNELPDEIIFGR